ncbi:lysylphosphatidylglycerol synthase transmembrane domain-containing protein [Ligilactobacillus hayakitensis]|nr:lysylphosphatidylglycerol synthase transmembrane domain-containing protein [Ligilactobacillus hayakitensis]
MTSKNRIALFTMFFIGILIMIFSLRNISMESFIHDLNNLNLWWLLVAFGCMFLSLVFEAIIIKVFVRRQVQHYPFRDALRVPMLEQLFNGITPFSTGGQPAQLFALTQSGIDAGRATSSTLMKFVVYQAMIVVNFIICLIIGFEFIAEKVHMLSILLILGFVAHFAVIVGLLLVMYWYNFTKKLVDICLKPVSWINQEKHRKWQMVLEEKIQNFYEESLGLKSDWKLLLKVCIYTLIQLILYYAIPYFILLSLGVTKANVILVISMHVLIVMIISLFPIPGGAGGAEYSFSIIFSSFIGSGSKLVLAMLLWRFVTYYFGMIAGLVALLVVPKKVKYIEKK